MAGRKVESVSNLTSKSIGTWITVRVVYKSNLISCKNGNKQLRLHLTDASGTISAVAYDVDAEECFKKFEIEKVYSICGFNLGTAKKEFTRLEHDYEITLNINSIIQLDENDSCVPGISYNFVTIADIAKMAPNQKVDCIAVCRDSHFKAGLSQNKTGYHKRVLKLFDNSDASIDLKLWGEDACRLDNQPPFIVAVKGAIIDVYNESISLNMSKGSTIKIDPDLPESHSLRKCLDPEHCDSLFYMACEGCNKKATMGNDGSYYCENCQTSLKLISEMKKPGRECLYDMSNKSYKNNHTKQVVWSTIATSIGMERSECQALWQSLRRKYKTAKSKNSGGSGNKHLELKGFSQIFTEMDYFQKFWEDDEPSVTNYVDSNTNRDLFHEMSQDPQINDSLTEYMEDSSQSIYSSPSNSKEIQKRKRSRLAGAETEYEESLNELASSVKKIDPFFLSLQDELLKVPENQKSALKLELMTLVIKHQK